MTRKALWAVIVVGLMLIVAPFALGVPSKASAGQRMMNDFRPIMQKANVDQSAAYYNDVFVPLGEVVPALSQQQIDKFSAYVQGFAAVGVDAQKLTPALAQALNITPEQAQALLAAQFPAMSQMLVNLPTMQKDFNDLVGLMSANVSTFGQVPAGLTHFKPLLVTMQNNVDNYKKADSLPPMNWFTWFFAVPGILFVGLGALGLFGGRKHTAPVGYPTAPSTLQAPVEKELVSSAH